MTQSLKLCTFLLAILTLPACGRGASTANVLGDIADRDAKIPVIIYYSNESGEIGGHGAALNAFHDFNVANLTRLGKDIPLRTPEQYKILENLATAAREDRARFPAASKAATDALDTVCGNQELGDKVAVASFTNRGWFGWRGADQEWAEAGHFWRHCGGGQPEGAEAWSVAGEADWKLDYRLAPLSHLDALSAALAAVRAKYPPDRYRYLLVTHTHGALGYAVAPLMTHKQMVNLPERIPTMALPIVEGIANKTQFWYLKMWEETHGNAGLSLKDPILLSAMFNDAIGIKKEQYLSVIRSSEMLFEALILQSCESGLYNTPLGIQPTEIPNIARFFTSGSRGVRYDAIDYRAAIAASDPVEGLVAAAQAGGLTN